MDGTLKVSPDELIKTASAFGSSSATMRQATSEMTSIINSLIWEGDDCREYIAKFNGLQDDIDKMQAMIQEHVKDLNEMAQGFKKAQGDNITAISGLPADALK